MFPYIGEWMIFGVLTTYYPRDTKLFWKSECNTKEIFMITQKILKKKFWVTLKTLN